MTKPDFPPENKTSSFDKEIEGLKNSIANKKGDSNSIKKQIEDQIKIFERLGVSKEEIDELRKSMKNDSKNNVEEKVAETKELSDEEKEILAIENEYNPKIEGAQKKLDELLKEKTDTDKENSSPEAKNEPEDIFEAAKKRTADLINEKLDEEKRRNQEEIDKLSQSIQKDLTPDDKNIDQGKNESEVIAHALLLSGIKEKDLEKIPEWKNLSDAEKLLVTEQVSQEMLSKVKEIGEQRFQEKNKINFSIKKFNPLSFGKKFLNNIGKAYWISREEKQVIKDVEAGRIGPSKEIVRQIIERTRDMNMNVIEKDGHAVIQFMEQDKFLPENQNKLIEIYNLIANKYARMPDSWKNERSASSKDGFFKKNYKQYKEAKDDYESIRSSLLKVKTEQYEYSGFSKKEAEEKAMLEMRDNDFNISILQFINTNPDAISELNKIKNEISYGRLLNNENIWRGIYIGTGYAARGIASFASTFGVISAPLIAGMIGGARARRKANEKINATFSEGRGIETSKERREAHKKGLFDDKNENRGFISKTLSGKDINAKEVAGFVDADSQIQRLNNLLEKIERGSSFEERLKYRNQLCARVEYIENKFDKGLINYGTKNSIGVNYELIKRLSFAQAQLGLLDFMHNNESLKETNERRGDLLKTILSNHSIRFNKNQISFKDMETIRGTLVAAGFSFLGWQIRGWFHGGNNPEITANNVHEETPTSGQKITQEESDTQTETETGDNSQTTESSQQTTETSDQSTETKTEVDSKGSEDESDKQTQTEDDKGEEKATTETQPEKTERLSMKELANENSTKMAMKLGMYDGNKSMIVQSGSITFDDGQGNTVEVDYSSKGAIQTMSDLKQALHDKFGDNIPDGKLTTHYTDMKGVEHDQTLMSTDANGTTTVEQYKGDKFDSDHSSTTTENQTEGSNSTNQDLVNNQVDPVTGKPIVAGEHANPSDLQNQQVDPVTGKEMVDTKHSGGDQNDNSTTSGASGEKNVNVSPEEIAKQVSQTAENNINHVFPTESALNQWGQIKTMDASIFTHVSSAEVDEIYKPFVSYVHNLHDLTGLEPRVESIDNPVAENITDYIKRALEKAQEMGKLDDVKL